MNITKIQPSFKGLEISEVLEEKQLNYKYLKIRPTGEHIGRYSPLIKDGHIKLATHRSYGVDTLSLGDKVVVAKHLGVKKVFNHFDKVKNLLLELSFIEARDLKLDVKGDNYVAEFNKAGIKSSDAVMVTSSAEQKIKKTFYNVLKFMYNLAVKK